jgi:CRISPR-associated protein Csx10
MRSALVTATLTQTAALGVAGRADYRQDTYDHVPGSVLRGALAATWLRTPGAPGADHPVFREVFEGDGAFGPLHSAESLPTPLSMWTHKTGPLPTCPTPWWDETTDKVPDQCQHCPEPRATLERSKGQPVGRPRIGARSRIAIGADGIAENARLFRRAAVDAGTVLRGWVSGSALDALTPAGTPVTRLRFGGERSIRGLAEIQITDTTPPPLRTNGTDVILTLTSPGIFLDRFGYPTDKPAKAELADILNVEIKKVTAQPGWTRWTEVGGWHMASGLPKPRDRAVAAGSTYRVVCAQPPTVESLSELSVRGVGLKRREGYGALYRLPTADPAVNAIATLRTWSKWTRLTLFVRTNTQRPLPPGNLLRRLLDDDTLTPDQRAALQTLIDLPDGSRVARLLDESETR